MKIRSKSKGYRQEIKSTCTDSNTLFSKGTFRLVGIFGQITSFFYMVSNYCILVDRKTKNSHV
ncbi:hypothetical protein AtNW77_Chr1g0002911 [Arabidopsis thaliana]